MASREKSILGPQTKPGTNVYQLPKSAVLSITNTDAGESLVWVFEDASSTDKNLFGGFTCPLGTVNSQLIKIIGYLDGAPGASETLGFAISGLALSDNEAGDAAFSSEDTDSATIGSSGTGHSDKDLYIETISLSNLSITAGEGVEFQFAVDATNTTYSGQFLLKDLLFQWDDGS